MARRITEYRIFLATPSGLDSERITFRETIQDYNEIDALDRGVVFSPVGWEDTLGGPRRPQSLINSQLVQCDYFVLVLWDRWGTPPDGERNPQYTSGCEEEFHVASSCLGDPEQPMRQVIVFFKSVEARQLSDPGDQLKKVLAFKESLETTKKHFYMNFDDSFSFRKFLLRYLAQWVRDHEGGGPPSEPPVTPTPLIPSRERPSSREEFNRAEHLAEQGFLTEAEEIFARAISQNRDLEALDRYGNLLLRVDRLGQAEIMYRRLVESASSHEEEWRIKGYRNLGTIYQTRHDLDRAQEMYANALEILKALGRQEGASEIYGNLAIISEMKGEVDKATDLHRKALEVAREIGSDSVATMEFYSCFISYSHADKSFARRMHDQLQARGIRCWLDDHQLLPGDDINDMVDRGIRLWDKVLLCCSKASLTSWWVEDEIAKALEKERRIMKERGTKALALIPLNLDGFLLSGEWGSGKSKVLLSRLAADFTGWKTDNAKFEEQIDRVVKALRTEEVREAPPESKL